MTPSAAYLAAIEAAFKAGNATEHTHRPALKTLIEALRPGTIATNEPARIACGAPDYIVTQGDVPLGYVEAKDIGVDLDVAGESEQLRRYRDSLGNLILTDYLDFRLFRAGEPVAAIRIGTPRKDGSIARMPDAAAKLAALCQSFFDATVPVIASPRELATRLARLARLLDELIRKAFDTEKAGGALHAQAEAFRQVLLSGLTTEQFADMYAQTIAYGLFAARCAHPGAGFTRAMAGAVLPRTNPFLRRLFNTIAGPDLDERVAWVVDDIALLLARADMAAILKDFGRATRQEDPVVHFYETFLSAYDPKLKEVRGVYYTPEPVVDYLVRSTDALLKQEFGLVQGLADTTRVGPGADAAHKVQILDPACGTGTFLHSVIGLIREGFTKNLGLWPGYVAQHLLPRLHGFELLMAPYAVSHLKLALPIGPVAVGVAGRLGVYLTNALEPAQPTSGQSQFTQWLTEEAQAAGQVKSETPIMVVIGNPPYSGHSANKGTWITNLLSEYKRSAELKKPAQAKWLSDDYVKFIRFAQWRIERTGTGVLAFITNHSWLDNPTFRDMRESLMRTFNVIHVLDLHGNSKKKEKAPDGSADKNVFDIQQGVAITLMVRRGGTPSACVVKRADLWGTREAKYEWLAANDVTTTPWQTITPPKAPWFFVKQDLPLLAEYEQGWSVARIFSPNGDPAPGVVTTQDEFAISFSRAEAIAKVERFLATKSEAEARELFTLCSQSQWNYANAMKALADGAWREKVVPILYRPFDVRWTVWDSHVAVHRRERVMKHLLQPNLALVTARSNKAPELDHFFCAHLPVETKAGERTTQSSTFPLYLYGDKTVDLLAANRMPNLDPGFLAALGNGIRCTPPPPEEIFAYLYAVLHAPGYRARYADFLKRDFPCVPLPPSRATFDALATLGQRLIDLHLMRAAAPDQPGFAVAGRNLVDAPAFVPDASTPTLGRVRLNATQYFDAVPAVAWTFPIGGYQPAQKWLKDRKGRTLDFDDLAHYRRMIAALAETARIQPRIDEAAGSWPMQPKTDAA